MHLHALVSVLPLDFPAPQVELARMWEREPGVVCVRWSARAAPRLLDSLATSAHGAPHLALEGVSEFHFNEQGGWGVGLL